MFIHRYGLIYPACDDFFPVTHTVLTQIRPLHCYVMHAVDRNVHYAVSQELNPSHTLTGEDGQCHLFSNAHVLVSCLSMAWTENVEKWLFLSALSV